MPTSKWPPFVFVICLAAFVGMTMAFGGKLQSTVNLSLDRVVIPAPIQTVLYGGDRYLAANVEAFRGAATGVGAINIDVAYLLRSQSVVSELNPCHEDNWYWANAFLAWGGAEHYSSGILARATDCRFWDPMPPFFAGFNAYFFFKNFAQATTLLERAATRSEANASAFRKLAIVLKSESFKDEQVALQYLESERDQARDPSLKGILSRRVIRLQGLVTLRSARREFERRYREVLVRPEQLIQTGLLAAYPVDPLNIGYEFRNGEFYLRQVQVQ